MTTATLPSLAPNELSALVEFVRRLREKFAERIAHVWLFGSKARGDSGPESDIDLLVVTRADGWEFEKQVNRLALDVDLSYDVVLSDHMIDIDRFRQMAARQEPLYKNIQREGIDLWTTELQPTTRSKGSSAGTRS